ncbi:hypothetical protein QFZ23_002210 [Arthrobacter globiformis]|uniref:hypothetical protein n=1 Tax=Arthrobacter globiformis TaxID=1665 RepID=UPI002789435C|nr:hypothetical protein [Arthrobacter globiformis]MDQ1058309.1 hypothetical protein [Arthrobacter globiformis]
MWFIGGKHVRGMTLLLVMASLAGVLSACAYTDDEAAPATASPPVPSRPAPPPPPTADPALAKEQASNQTQLDQLLGPRPSDLVLGSSGGLGGDGHRTSLPGIPEGRYKVTSACVGVTDAALLIAQPDRRGGSSHELALKCGTARSMTVNLEAGQVFAHLVPMTTEPGTAAVAGFWLVPAP